jgi:peptide/nickel transport system permease protein
MAARYEKLIEGGMSPEAAAQAVKVLYGFQPDGTLWQQYTEYLSGLVRLDLGESVTRAGTPVVTVLGEAAKWTVLPVLAGTLLSFLVGVILGVFAAIKRTGKLGDALAVSGSLLHGIPQYVLAMLLVVIFATLIPILPADGSVDILYEPGFNAGYIGSLIEHAILPVVTYALSAYGGWILAMKSSVVTVLGDDFILAAELRGVKRSIIFRYITRNAILPLFTLLALSLGLLLGGAVFIEKIFNYPGLGWLLITSVQDRDFAVMSGAFLLITVATILANIVADLFYTVIDPRVRSGEESS